MSKYAIGLDFGTLSVRALLMDAETGEEIAAAVSIYPHGVIDAKLYEQDLPEGFALQDASDYRNGMIKTVCEVMRVSRVSPNDILGIGVDFTSSTVIAVKRDGTPLSELGEYEKEPHAYVKLWKHHGASAEAEKIDEVVKKRQEKWISYYGGRVSSEWMIPKILETYKKAPQIYQEADLFLEGLDWITYLLTGRLIRSKCGAGYKAFYREDTGYPSKDFFREIDPGIENLVEEKLLGELKGIGECAGYLTEKMAEKMLLKAGIPVAVGIIDAHASVPGSGIGEMGTMMIIMGTSSCHLMLSEKEAGIEGVGGLVKDGIMPGYFGYEAGQCCVGDHFDWFVKNGVPDTYNKEAKEKGISLYRLLEEKLCGYRAGKSGLLALDWFNGVRSPLMDYELSGCILGMTLKTKPEEIYLALIEATAYGTRWIIESFEEAGVLVERLVLGGGIPDKSPFIVQIYADVTGKPVCVTGSSQVCARGSAILGIAAADKELSGYEDAGEIAKKLGSVKEKIYLPNDVQTEIYNELYKEYRTLTEYFGHGENNVMKRLGKLHRQLL